jgi:hypothetical protein
MRGFKATPGELLPGFLNLPSPRREGVNQKNVHIGSRLIQSRVQQKQGCFAVML